MTVHYVSEAFHFPVCGQPRTLGDYGLTGDAAEVTCKTCMEVLGSHVRQLLGAPVNKSRCPSCGTIVGLLADRCPSCGADRFA